MKYFQSLYKITINMLLAGFICLSLSMFNPRIIQLSSASLMTHPFSQFNFVPGSTGIYFICLLYIFASPMFVKKNGERYMECLWASFAILGSALMTISSESLQVYCAALLAYAGFFMTTISLVHNNVGVHSFSNLSKNYFLIALFILLVLLLAIFGIEQYPGIHNSPIVLTLTQWRGVWAGLSLGHAVLFLCQPANKRRHVAMA